MYRCIVCKEPMTGETNMVGFQCPRCGSHIFVKERPPVVKKVVAE